MTIDATDDGSETAGQVRRPDRRGGLMAAGFLVLLLASEAALTLPDEDASSSAVAQFYASHRTVIVVLQLLGLVAAALLGGYAVRLLRADRVVGATGVILAALACVPGVLTAATALISDPSHPAASGTLNRLEPRADDVLFLGVLLFAVAVAVRLRHAHRWLATIAALTAVTTLGRLTLEAVGSPRGLLDSIAPMCFLLLVGWLGALSLRGTLPTAA